MVLVVDLLSDGLPGKSKLPSEAARPDDDGDDSNEAEAQPTAGLAREPVGVKDQETDDKSADDGTSTLQSGNNRPRRSIKLAGVDSSLIGVEVVGSEEHWEKRYMPRAGKLGLSERRI